MKTRIISVILLLTVLTVLLRENGGRITDTLLNIINPIKQSYTHLTQDLEHTSQSYLFQQESIERLNKENRVLRKRLLAQTHYIEQIKDIYSILPSLKQVPLGNISILETISYVKLNSFSQIILTKPKILNPDKTYGLIQGKVVAGIARVHKNQLYGYLTSDKKCQFTVFIGEKRVPGIAIGMQKNEMQIKFIPKWDQIKEGDLVKTSGLDGIFFAGIPVGVVTKVEIQSAYKVAYIQTYNDIYHPRLFFLIHDTQTTLVEKLNHSTIHLDKIK